MFRSALVGGAAAEIEAITAERDFFKEKYTEQIDAQEELKNQAKLKDAMIDKLRGKILELEMEKSKIIPRENHNGESRPTSVLTEEDESSKSCGNSTTDKGAKVDNEDTISLGDNNNTQDTLAEGCNNLHQNADSPMDKQRVEKENGVESDDSGEDDDDDDDDDINKIRLNAERMLMWANYQTSKRSNSTTNKYEDDGSKKSESSTLASRQPSKNGTMKAIFSPLPNSFEDRRQVSLDDDDNSTLESNSRYQPERSIGSGSGGGGKIGKLFNNLMDKIADPHSESESEDDSDAESEASSNFADREILYSEM